MNDDSGWTRDDIVDGAPKATSKMGLFLIGATGGLGAALSIVSVPFVSPALRRICLPYVPATARQVENVMLALRGRDGTLVDLGSGDGRLVFAAAEKGFRASGVELNAWLVLFSKVSSRLRGSSSRTKFHRRDLWKFDLSGYDNVVVFGVEQMMEELERKFAKELSKDCRIVACRFPLPNLKPLRTVGHGVDTVWVYAVTSEGSRR